MHTLILVYLLQAWTLLPHIADFPHVVQAYNIHS